ncbi:MAG: SH3 domain-containing protein [Planctomycetota bacterium]|jgi:hypothetical protein
MGRTGGRSAGRPKQLRYYPVAKLDAGSRVRVVGQEGEWLAIVPPDGCYSLIADSYVDVGDDDIGVVNGDNVRVRAGSQLQPDKYYAIQLKLSEGAEVEILDHVEKLGSDEMGYYRIVPPAGAQLWASGKFVQRVPEELLALAAADKTALPAETGESPAAAPPQEEPAVPQPDVPDPDALKAKAEDYRAQLEQIDADLKAELAKPLFRRDFEPIIDRFTPLANQEIDEYSAVYAATRIAQVEDKIEEMEAVARVRQLGEQVKTDRKVALAARAGIRPIARSIKEGFDAEGELRYSAIYDSSAGPQRFRLVDPASAMPRTIGYVEIPPDSGIDATDYLGRIIGVRAREVRLQTGEVDPIAIYVAAELVVLETPSG